MGALQDVGFLGSDTNLSDNQRLQIINEVSEAMRTASKINLVNAELSLISSAVPLAADKFEANNGLNTHRDQYAQWHQVYLDTFLTSVAGMFDAIPTTGVAAKAIPIIDPTQPIIDILNELKNLFPDLFDFDIVDFLISILPRLFLKIPKLLIDLAVDAMGLLRGNAESISNSLDTFIDFIKDNVVNLLDKAKSQIDKIKDLFESLKNLLKLETGELFSSVIDTAALKEKFLLILQKIAKSIIDFPDLPNLDISIPNFSFDLSLPGFTFPSLPKLPIFHISPPFPPGIAYFLLEFIKKIVAGIAQIISRVQDLINAFLQGIAAFIQYIVQSIFDLIKSIIELLIPNIDRAVTLAATILILSKKITQMAVVSILGWLVGPGIIINVAAREVGLVA